MTGTTSGEGPPQTRRVPGDTTLEDSTSSTGTRTRATQSQGSAGVSQSASTTSPTHGDLVVYDARRRAGRRAGIPSGDPIADAQAIAEVLGPRAVFYLRQMLAELSNAWPRDEHGQRIDFDAIYSGVGS